MVSFLLLNFNTCSAYMFLDCFLALKLLLMSEIEETRVVVIDVGGLKFCSFIFFIIT